MKHKIYWETKLPGGTELWSCPTCGRRLAVNWYPKFKRAVLSPGDESVEHVGNKGIELDSWTARESELH